MRRPPQDHKPKQGQPTPQRASNAPPEKSPLTVPATCRFNTGVVELVPGKKAIVLIVESVNGTFHFFMEPEYVETLKASLDRSVAKTRTSLYTPPVESVSTALVDPTHG